MNKPNDVLWIVPVMAFVIAFTLRLFKLLFPVCQISYNISNIVFI